MQALVSTLGLTRVQAFYAPTEKRYWRPELKNGCRVVQLSLVTDERYPALVPTPSVGSALPGRAGNLCWLDMPLLKIGLWLRLVLAKGSR